MFEKEGKPKKLKYISCIKVNGIAILPPLITYAKRKDIHKCKQQAIKLEKRLKRERELKDYINKYYTPKLKNYTNILLTSTLEHQLSFDDIVPVNENVTNLEDNKVPFTLQKKTPKLSCNLQVSQYANDKFTVLTSFQKCKSSTIVIDEPDFSCTDNLKSVENDSENEIDLSEVVNQKPKLIRSNSYILETPSPMLLEHLKRQNDFGEIDIDEGMPFVKEHNSDYARDSEIPNIHLQDITKKDIVYQGISSLDDENSIGISSISRSESELKNISTYSDQISDNGHISIKETQYQLKEFIDNNLPQMLDNNIFLEENGTRKKSKCNSRNTNENYLKSSFNTFQNNLKPVSLTEQLISCDDQNLNKILHDIPEIYSKQIIELLEKQKQEQLTKMKKDVDIQDSCICNSKIKNDYKQKDYTSDLLNFVSNSNQNFNSHIVPQGILWTNTYRPSIYQEASSSLEIINKISEETKQIHNETVINCSCELFSGCNRKAKQPLTEEHAASIIVAAAKGYLIRRLMRTDRIQGFIQTIRDALICAMQLHSESTETINESDIELHRRLIQQVSAVCFEFHEVFFLLSATEQMAIIRLDRERQKEKLKRPLSRVSSASKSSRSSRSIIK